MPNGLITPGLVIEVSEAVKDYRVTSAEYSEIMGTVSSIIIGTFTIGLVGMLMASIKKGFSRPQSQK